MSVKKRRILDRKFSLLRGNINGRVQVYLAGRHKDVCLSFEIEVPAWSGLPGRSAAEVRA